MNCPFGFNFDPFVPKLTHSFLAASNLAAFHRSYALADADQCTQQALNEFYNEGNEEQDSFYSQYKQRKGDLGGDEQMEWIDENFEGQYDPNNEDEELGFSINDRFAAFANLIGVADQCCCCCTPGDGQCARNCRSDSQCTQQCKQCQTKKCCCCCERGDEQCKQGCHNSAECTQQCAKEEKGVCKQCCCCCGAQDTQCKQNCQNRDDCTQQCASGQCNSNSVDRYGTDIEEAEEEDWEGGRRRAGAKGV